MGQLTRKTKQKQEAGGGEKLKVQTSKPNENKCF